MKYFLIIVLSLNFIYCNAQKKDSLKVIAKELPAYQSVHISKNIQSISRTNSYFKSSQVIIFNNREYSIDNFKNIIDTLGDDFSFDVKFDSIDNKKKLIIKQKL